MSTVQSAAQVLPTRFAESSWAKRHPLLTLYAMAYGVAWLIWIPSLVLSRNGLGILPFTSPATPIVILSSFAPAVAAFVTTAMVEGRPGVSQLLRRLVQWRAGIQWYLFIVFAYPIAFFAVSVGLGAIPLNTVLQNWSMLFTTYPIVLIAQTILAGGLGEEPGWRGFALPRLQPRFGALPASLIIGALWVGWHIPLFFVPELSQGHLNFVLYLLTGLALSSIMTWVYNNTGGSILIMMILHEAEDTTANISLRIAPGYLDRTLAYVIAFGLIAAAIIVFTKGKLSYEPGKGAEVA